MGGVVLCRARALRILGVGLVLMMGCPPPPADTLGPILEMGSPINLGQSPQGIRKREILQLKNVGDSPLIINDFKLEPDDGTFTIQISALPLTLKRDHQKEMVITFLPFQEGPAESTLTFDYESQYAQPSPIVLKGKGVSNLVCLSCLPPPEPECGLDGESSIYYESTAPTDCENENGICSYLMMERICEDSLCEDENGTCGQGEPPILDSGTQGSFHDSGVPGAVNDSGTLLILSDSGPGIHLSDSGTNWELVDSGRADPCSDVVCGENAICVDAYCQCAEGFSSFDGGMACFETCGENDCSDDNLCTLNDTCDGQGGCVGVPVICNTPPSSQCYEPLGACDTNDGQCDYTVAAGACDDNNLCTLNDECNNGVCVSGNSKVCNTPPRPQCYDPVGTCNAANGNCDYNTLAGNCDDGDACTVNDQCNNGMCNPGAQKVCNNPPGPQCYNPNGTCNVAGNCDYTTIAGACNDNDPCTVNDQCNNGACSGTPMVCNNSGSICKSNTGTCQAGSCFYPNIDGIGCDDLDGCTQTDTCLGGACVGSNPIVCDEHEGDGCFDQGTCTDGVCDYPINEGKNCNDGDECLLNDKCQADGTCKGDTPRTCSGEAEPENPCLEIRSACDSVEGCTQNKAAASDNCCDGEGGHRGGTAWDSFCTGCTRFDEETGEWVPQEECCCGDTGECISYDGQTGGTANYELCGF